MMAESPEVEVARAALREVGYGYIADHVVESIGSNRVPMLDGEDGWTLASNSPVTMAEHEALVRAFLLAHRLHSTPDESFMVASREAQRDGRPAPGVLCFVCWPGQEDHGLPLWPSGLNR